MKIKTATLGYLRIAKNREVKKVLSAFWSGRITSESLLQTVKEVEEANWKTQLDTGIDKIGVWQIRPEEVISKLETIKDIVTEFEVQPSAYLQFVAYEATRETQLPEALSNVLSFAEQKLQEVVFLAHKITVRDAKCNHEPLVNFNRDNSQNQSKFDATKLRVTRYKKDQKELKQPGTNFAILAR